MSQQQRSTILCGTDQHQQLLKMYYGGMMNSVSMRARYIVNCCQFIVALSEKFTLQTNPPCYQSVHEIKIAAHFSLTSIYMRVHMYRKSASEHVAGYHFSVGRSASGGPLLLLFVGAAVRAK